MREEKSKSRSPIQKRAGKKVIIRKGLPIVWDREPKKDCLGLLDTQRLRKRLPIKKGDEKKKPHKRMPQGGEAGVVLRGGRKDPLYCKRGGEAPPELMLVGVADKNVIKAPPGENDVVDDNGPRIGSPSSPSGSRPREIRSLYAWADRKGYAVEKNYDHATATLRGPLGQKKNGKDSRKNPAKERDRFNGGLCERKNLPLREKKGLDWHCSKRRTRSRRRKL